MNVIDYAKKCSLSENTIRKWYNKGYLSEIATCENNTLAFSEDTPSIYYKKGLSRIKKLSTLTKHILAACDKQQIIIPELFTEFNRNTIERLLNELETEKCIQKNNFAFNYAITKTRIEYKTKLENADKKNLVTIEQLLSAGNSILSIFAFIGLVV